MNGQPLRHCPSLTYAALEEESAPDGAGAARTLGVSYDASPFRDMQIVTANCGFRSSSRIPDNCDALLYHAAVSLGSARALFVDLAVQRLICDDPVFGLILLLHSSPAPGCCFLWTTPKQP
jgi:hypothetical protein